jgi:hypothetical protein
VVRQRIRHFINSAKQRRTAAAYSIVLVTREVLAVKHADDQYRYGRLYGIASAQATCPSKSSDVAISR